MYNLKRVQLLPICLQAAWDFFSSPINLSKITPLEMDFTIRYISGGSQTYSGQIIHYKIKILPWVKVNWVTEITHVDPLRYFVDDQRFGPYAMWHHQHHFKETAEGTEMTDEVSYAIPYGLFGRMAHWLFVGRQVNAIFNHRSKALEAFFIKEKEENRNSV